MTKKTITYGVKGMIEWHASLKAGRSIVHVHFTGGSLSAYGVTAAEYVTSNPLMQHIIEQSDYFKSGKITIVRKYEEKGKQSAVDKKTVSAEAKTRDSEKEYLSVEVTCLDDARSYLKEKCGVEASSLRTAKAIMAQAEANKIVFVGI